MNRMIIMTISFVLVSELLMVFGVLNNPHSGPINLVEGSINQAWRCADVIQNRNYTNY